MSQLGQPNKFHREEGSGARNRSERICCIVNPKAGAGAAGRNVDALKLAVDRAFEQWEVRLTEGPRHASELAAAAVEQGFDIVAAVGGDGTCHEVVGGMFDGERPRSRRVTFAVVPFGTGGDLIRSLRIPKGLSDALWIAATGITLPTDVGHVRLADPDGPSEDVFINVAGFGINGDVVRRANAMDKRWGGGLVFFAATVRSVLRYQPAEVRLRWEGPNGDGEHTGTVNSGFVANGAWCGGGMWVGKGGTMQDGAFDLTVLPAASVARQLTSAPRLYNGKLDGFPGAVRATVTRLIAEPVGDDLVPIDLDGETPGHLPAEFKVLPRALNVRGGWVHSPLLDPPTDR